MKKYISAILLLTNLLTQAQIYTPYDTIDKPKRTALIDFIAPIHKLDYAAIDDLENSKLRKLKREIIGDNQKEIVSGLKKGTYIINKEIDDYIFSLVNEVITYNLDLKNQKITFLISKEFNPNAYSIGDGIFVLRLSLISKLKNEAQLVSVICHEIAHYILKHRDKSIQKYADYLTSDETKKDLKDLKKTTFNKSEKAEKLLKEFIYNKKNKSRDFEKQADSLGFIYFKNTKYNTNEVITSLNILDKLDTETDSLTAVDYKKLFAMPNYPFKEGWLQKEDFSQYNYSKEHLFKWDVDSLKTHPECLQRIKYLEKDFSSELKKVKKDTINYSVNQKYFENLSQTCVYESISNLYFLENYGVCLYETLKLLKTKPDDRFLLHMVVKCFEKQIEYRKDHKLNAYVPSIDPTEHSKSMQLYINFIQNLSNPDAKNIYEYYKQFN